MGREDGLKGLRAFACIMVVLGLAGVLAFTYRANLASEQAQATKLTGPPKYIRIMLNGEPLRTPALGRIIDTRSVVPLRPIAEAAGATVKLDQDGKTLYITLKEVTLKTVIGQTRAYINDQTVNLEIAPQMCDGQVLVPLNLIQQPLSLDVSWDNPERTLKITTPGYTPSMVAKTNQPQSVPILMYHEIGDGPNNLYVRESEFREQMRYLRDNNYKVVTMAEGIRMMQNRQSMNKTVIITFDDGYESFLTKAWPILRENKFPATVFVIAYYAGVENYLTWDQMIMLRADWMEIGSHSESHPALSKISSSRFNEEIYGSKKLIEDCLQVPCEDFCYPGGFFSHEVAETVKQAGYLSAVTTQYGHASLKNDMYQLPRVRIPRGMSISTFAKSL